MQQEENAFVALHIVIKSTKKTICYMSNFLSENKM